MLKQLHGGASASVDMERLRTMVRAARRVRRQWFKMATLSAERGEEFKPVDLAPVVDELARSQRHSLSLLASCHSAARPSMAAA